MTSVGKVLLYLELVVCFGAVTALLAMGMLLLPVWLMSAGVKVLALLGLLAVSDSGPAWNLPVSIATVVAGLLGLIGVAQLVQLEMKSAVAPTLRPSSTLGLVGAGVLSLCLYNFVVQPTDLRSGAIAFPLFFLPLAGTLHLLFLARTALFRRAVGRTA